jgi:hypothetical protein
MRDPAMRGERGGECDKGVSLFHAASIATTSQTMQASNSFVFTNWPLLAMLRRWT